MGTISPGSMRVLPSWAGRLSLVALALAAAACNKSKNEAPPSLAASAAAQPSVAAAPSAPSTPQPAVSIAPPIAPAVTPASDETASKEHEKAHAATASKSFSACCAALHKQAAAASGPAQGKLKSAALTCDGIAKVVESGKTSAKDGYTAVRASLRGAPLPAGCK